MFTREEKEKFEFLKLIKLFKTSENFLLYKRLRQLRLLLYPYRQNYADLLRFHQIHQRIGDTSTFWSDQKPFVRWNLQKNINASLLNYLSAAGAVIDLSRSFSKKELSQDRLVSYRRWIKTQFVERIEFSFIRELRNYILHYKYLAVDVSLSIKFSTSSTKRLSLTTSDLLQWDGWNAQQRVFISGQDKKLDFIPLIIQYHDAFITTQDLLFLMAIQSHGESLKSLITEMLNLNSRSQEIEFVSALPFRPSTIRYLQWILSIADKQANKF